MSAIASSAVASVSTPGVFATQNPTPRRGVHVDVVVTDGVVCDDPEPVACGNEKLVVHLVAQHRHETRAASRAGQELRAVRREFRIVDAEVEKPLQFGMHGTGYSSCKENPVCQKINLARPERALTFPPCAS